MLKLRFFVVETWLFNTEQNHFGIGFQDQKDDDFRTRFGPIAAGAAQTHPDRWANMKSNKLRILFVAASAGLALSMTVGIVHAGGSQPTIVFEHAFVSGVETNRNTTTFLISGDAKFWVQKGQAEDPKGGNGKYVFLRANHAVVRITPHPGAYPDYIAGEQKAALLFKGRTMRLLLHETSVTLEGGAITHIDAWGYEFDLNEKAAPNQASQTIGSEASPQSGR